jgi:hypothetical protein
MGFGPGNAFGITSRLCALLTSVVRQGFALASVSSGFGFLRPANLVGETSVRFGEMVARAFCVLSVLFSLLFLSPAVGDVLRRHALQAPAYGDRGRSFEHSPVSGYWATILRRPLPAPLSIYLDLLEPLAERLRRNLGDRSLVVGGAHRPNGLPLELLRWSRMVWTSVYLLRSFRRTSSLNSDRFAKAGLNANANSTQCIEAP